MLLMTQSPIIYTVNNKQMILIIRVLIWDSNLQIVVDFVSMMMSVVRMLILMQKIVQIG